MKMEKMNALTLIITLVVGVILTGALLGPVISDATKTHETFTNTGAFYVELDPADEYTIEYDAAEAANKVTINDTTIDVPNGYTILALDNSILRIQDNTLQYKGAGSYIVNIIKCDLSVSNGTVTGSYYLRDAPTTEVSWPSTTYTKAYVASPTQQDYVMTVYNTTSKMTGDSDIFAFGQTGFVTSGSTVLYLIKIEGTIDDGVTVSILDRTTGVAVSTATVEDLSINKTAVAGYVDLYDLTSITFKAKILDTDNWTNVSYSAYIVPSEVTAELSDHLTPGQISLMGAIPVMVIVALLMAAVGAIAYRRAD